MEKNEIFCLSFFSPLDQTPKIKICHIFASENPEVIERGWRLIDTDSLESDEAAEDGSIDNYGTALGEEDESGSGEAGLRTGVTQSGTEEV